MRLELVWRKCLCSLMQAVINVNIICRLQELYCWLQLIFVVIQRRECLALTLNRTKSSNLWTATDNSKLNHFRTQVSQFTILQTKLRYSWAHGHFIVWFFDSSKTKDVTRAGIHGSDLWKLSSFRWGSILQCFKQRYLLYCNAAQQIFG